MRFSTCLPLCLAALSAAAFLACPSVAQEAPAMDLRSLGPTASVLMGQNGNVLIIPGPDGALLVDDQRDGDLPRMQAAVRTLTEGPVRFVINTHWHLDHSGANADFGRAGAVLIAHRNVRTRLATEQYMAAYRVRIPASPEIAWPSIVFDTTMEMHFGGETLTLRHAPSAHTDGDILVKLERANVIHMGDVFFNGMFPFIDRSSGGGIEGLIGAVDMALAMSDDATRIVPAHGEIATRAELQAYRDMLRTLADQVKARREAGETFAQVRAARLTAPWPLEGEADGLVAAIYGSYARP
ncbi:MBL fold metallo-hydrolase [Brevundimonas sp. Root1423]|uniref:MBL fold metallo-hydrolase n=1 Tax=Brevundimonas sp. Root1423 TaxID=1736462 RepID=UPI00070182A8|nr:MBL fold metallo-hydrolase [Brevundimonas sp. Root1423]KQY89849.1 hypothetical protein ASD25_04780 [Brevundimonas sp. Root1423]